MPATPASLSVLAVALGLALAAPVHAGAGSAADAVQLDDVVVVGHRQNLVGEAISASEGVVGPAELAARPLLRSGDLLEFVPGMVATQHSGSGKANQYFLRGFNLDHGSDFATYVDGMPVNMRTHAHGQGYTDLNFMIAEAVGALHYRKGTYYADVGDFSSAGSARFRIADELPQGVASLSVGGGDFRRALLAQSVTLGGGALLAAGEAQRNDGAWRDVHEDVRRNNLLLRYSVPLAGGRAHAMAMAYENQWNSPDQIPQRAVRHGLIDPLGSLDRTLGGEASRYSLSGGWSGSAFGGELEASAYVINSDLQLWSNFTYFLDDPERGDQFQQVDQRRISGASVSQQWQHGRQSWRVGGELRQDDIARAALYRARARQRIGTVSDDAVGERSVGVFAAHEWRLSPTLRTHLGARHDRYRFAVDGRIAENNGRARDSITSFKAGVAWTPLPPLELYADVGDGFHSNDARGTTMSVDPSTGEPVQRVDPLVGSRGAELGARLFFSDHLHATLTWWTLALDSELLFVGDAATTEAGRASRREGGEMGLYWHGHDWLTADIEVAYTDARLDDADPDGVGRRLPGALPWVVGAGLRVETPCGWVGSARLRHFGAYPLIEEGSVRADASTMLNLRVGRKWSRWGVYLDVFNALDSDDHDVSYFYASRLPGEPDEGVDDLHYHAFEPRTARLSLRWSF